MYSYIDRIESESELWLHIVVLLLKKENERVKRFQGFGAKKHRKKTSQKDGIFWSHFSRQQQLLLLMMK